MTNLKALELAFDIMKAHNELTGFETFKDIEINPIDDYVAFDVPTFALGAADMICSLLNLTLHIEVNSDPTDDRQLNYYIN